jgi:molybdopterin synthase catalytic subunit
MDFYELTQHPVSVESVSRRIIPLDCGATVTLDGYARKFTKDKKTGEIRETLYLVYEAYEEMALKEMKKLIDQAREAFEISHVGIVHRLGRLDIGETSVVISVAAPHRKAAFAACEWLIRELKRTVPIWKKEVYADGEHWVEGEAEANVTPARQT